MDKQRAEQIMKSSDTIQVLFHGSPVWIDSLTDANTAHVHFINDTQRKEEVPVYKLVENNPMS